MPFSDCYLTSISKSITNDFLAHYEHLGNVGLGIWHKGFYIEKKLAATLSFGTTCFYKKKGIWEEFVDIKDVRIIQLCRGATASWAPKNTPSKIISLALKQVRKDFGPTIVVAFSDPIYGEVGTVYQSTNAIFTGWTNPKGQATYIVDGRKMSGWSVYKKYNTRSKGKLKLIDPNVKIIPLNPKMRYVYISAPKRQKRKLLKKLSPYKKPYPKRGTHNILSMKEALLNKSF